ncbi:molybdate ABC transporter permease subunit [Xanthocytophaga agilis]|uniref:Molybdenum transport system permease n=1 Tax=Xanthocytophaga agilis TaxID=3048010 RepID=A0AAE3RB34_9BACT|nr:molybdate ABC transporter permease subunit [Xanthocytophaga agilis]MDJ1504865.1 molybdate ABC transporter permease subunit [Xanthocytophaga agilis]
MEEYLETLLLTCQLAFCTTFILLILSIPLAYGLAFFRFRIKPIIEALISLPLVLPPTVLGFYLLVTFSPENMLGHWLEKYLHVSLNFTFAGILIGSTIYSLPFMVHPIQAGFENFPSILLDASYTLGKSRMTTLWKVILPNIKPSLLSGIVLTFAHTMGEFGVILMIGGNIPGETRVASIVIYDLVEDLKYKEANQYALALLLFSFALLIALYRLSRRTQSHTLF